METTNLFGKPTEFRACTSSDVLDHFLVIRDTITDMPHEEFMERMQKCVTAGSAFTLADNTAFLYYLNTSSRKAIGMALYGSSAVGTLALFKGIFQDTDHRTLKIDFKLHPGKLLQEYKSLVTISSLHTYGVTERPLVVRIDALRDKLRLIHARWDT